MCSLPCSQGGVGLLFARRSKAPPPNLPLHAGGGAKAKQKAAARFTLASSRSRAAAARQVGWPFLFGYFLFGLSPRSIQPSKEKVTRPPKEDETLLSSKTTKPNHSIATEVAPTRSTATSELSCLGDTTTKSSAAHGLHKHRTQRLHSHTIIFVKAVDDRAIDIPHAEQRAVCVDQRHHDFRL